MRRLQWSDGANGRWKEVTWRSWCWHWWRLMVQWRNKSATMQLEAMGTDETRAARYALMQVSFSISFCLLISLFPPVWAWLRLQSIVGWFLSISAFRSYYVGFVGVRYTSLIPAHHHVGLLLIYIDGGLIQCMHTSLWGPLGDGTGGSIHLVCAYLSAKYGPHLIILTPASTANKFHLLKNCTLIKRYSPFRWV